MVVGSCDKEDASGTVLFYTNAQFLLNCGPFEVEVFINDSYAGTIELPLLPIDSIPNCTSGESQSLLLS